MRSSYSYCITLFGLLTASPVVAQSRPGPWSLEFFGGTAFNLHTPFVVSQAGQPELDLVAEWDTRPFHGTPYYAYRVARMDSTGRSGWAFDFTHHKIYLENRPPEIQTFEISHGYNLLVFSHLWQRSAWLWSFGGGLVIGHPENTVRGLRHLDDDGGTFGGGYYLCGAVVQGGVGRLVELNKEFFASALTKVTAADCRVPVRGGWAEAPNIATHINLGVGVRW